MHHTNTQRVFTENTPAQTVLVQREMESGRSLSASITPFSAGQSAPPTQWPPAEGAAAETATGSKGDQVGRRPPYTYGAGRPAHLCAHLARRLSLNQDDTAGKN